MYYIGLDVHKKTISYCVKEASGQIQQEGTIAATRTELDSWMKTLPQPWMVAMEASIFTGWVYDHLLLHATKVKVAHPLMLRAIFFVATPTVHRGISRHFDECGHRVRQATTFTKLNAHAERFVRSIKESCLDRLILFGQHSLRRATREFLTRYHQERNHQGLGNHLIVSDFVRRRQAPFAGANAWVGC